ncbi:MAG: PAS domain-containing protein, partial [Marivita sp.]
MLDTKARSDSLLAAFPDAALLLDTSQDKVVALNGAAAALFGIDPVATHALRFSGFLGAALAKFVVFVEEVDHRGECWTRDVPLYKVDGSPLRCEIRARGVPDQAGFLLLSFTDLDAFDKRTQIAESAELHRAGLLEWKRAETFFAELERQNQLILNAAGEGIYGVNAEGKTTFVNRAAQEMLGWTTQDLLGKDIHSMIHHHHLNGEVYPS